MIEPARNPFPGPQPYRAVDRGVFFGRDKLARELESRVLVDACTTVFGPSGAGKSSLMQAAVIPRLEEEHDFRVVCVDAWPPGAEPLPWLVRTLFTELDLGASLDGKGTLEALDEAMRRAELRSERPLLIYLDQIEQILVPSRDPVQAALLFEGVERLAQRPMRGLQLVLSLREDYLGRFRDRARGRRLLLDHGFRLGPLTVGEMVAAVLAAAGAGALSQQWDEEETRKLMCEVRVAGESATEEAEVQAVFGQIVCRALWEERVAGKGRTVGMVEAEAIVQRYLEVTLEGLGSHREEARRLLEEHLIDEDGRRRLLMEEEARGKLSEGAAQEVLERLEQAAVLRAEGRQGSRYFELGHDWLARKVFERRQARERDEELQRRVREEEERRRAKPFLLLTTITLGPVLVSVALLINANTRPVLEAEMQLESAVVNEVAEEPMRPLREVEKDAFAVAAVLSRAMEGKISDEDAIESVRALIGSRESIGAVRFEVPEAKVSTAIRWATVAAPVPESTSELRALADAKGIAVSVEGPSRGVVVSAIRGPAGKNAARGYVTVHVDLDELATKLDGIRERRFGGAASFVLATHDGKVIAASGVPSSVPGDSIAGLPLWSVMPSGAPEEYRVQVVGKKFIDHDTPMVGTIQSMPERGWVILVWRPESIAYGVLAAMRRTGLLVAVLAAALAVIVSFYAANAITASIFRIVGEGNRKR
jgi:hypothetical protein